MIKPFQSGLVPLGHFDFDDTQLSLLKGGEVVVLDKKEVSVVEKTATDVYVDTDRTGFRLANEADIGPFFFTDPGTNGGGFSNIAAERTSLFSTGHGVITYEQASSKATVWGTEGFYTISIDAIDPTIDDTLLPNTELYVSEDGQLTITPSSSGRIVGYFIEYRKKSVVANRLYTMPGTEINTDVVVVYKLNADGYNANSAGTTIDPDSLTLGQPTDGYFSDGYFNFTSTTRIADAVDEISEHILSISGGANTALSNLGPTSINQDLLPDTDATHLLGSPTLRWKDGYFGPTSLHIVGTAAEVGIETDWRLGLNSSGSFTVSNNSDSLIITPDGYVGISKIPTAHLDISGFIKTDSGIILSDNSVISDMESILPSQSGNAGNFLYTDGSTTSWRGIRASDILAQFAISTFAVTSATREVGESVSPASFTATYNRTPASAILTDNNGSSAVDVTSTPTAFNSAGPFVKTTNNSSVIFTLTANDGVDPNSVLTSTMRWRPRVYYGIGVDGISTEAGIEGLPSYQLLATKALTFTVTAGATDHIYYAAPSSYGTPTFTVGGFSGGFTLVGTISVTNIYSVTQDYVLYKSTNANLGNTTVVVT
jgi:hypothetical protein